MQTRSDEIDYAFERFKAIARDASSLDKSKWSEADTRLKVIDRILFDVLGWDRNETNVEEPAGSGFTDYTIHTLNSARMIVEAKRDAVSFGLNNRQSGRAYKLNGPVFNTEASAAIKQAVIYSAFKNCELACVTNGAEWIIFRANRLGDGKDTLEGMGFVFCSLEAIEVHFKEFFDLLGKSAVEALTFRGVFQKAEGIPIRDLSFLKPPRNPASKRLLQRGRFAADFDALMASFFARLKGDQDAEMIQKCFVVTPESEFADKKLMRIAEDLVEKVRKLDADTGHELVELIEAAQLQHRNRFILLVGNKGAGKSTFVDRFFQYALPAQIAEGLVPLRIDLAMNSGDLTSIIQWLNQRLLEAGEKAVFPFGATDWNDCMGRMFFDDYTRWASATMSHLYQKDKSEFKIEFGRHIEKMRENKPDEYIRRLIRYITHSNRKIPCLVFDNTDHFTIQFQEAVFQYARSIYESEFCIVLVPITDKTSWQLSKQGALQSFESEALFLPVPQPERVIERRITFLLEKLRDEDEKRRGIYFLERGIRLRLEDIKAFAVSLNRIFVNSKDTSRWIGGLANHDIRRLLELTKDTIASPHLRLDDLLKAYFADESEVIPEYRIKQAIIKRRYDIYPMGEHSFVQNVFALNLEPATTPLLGIRILQFLHDATDISDKQEHEFVPVETVYDYFNALGIQSTVTNCWLTPLLQKGLVLNYDPTVMELNPSSSIEISPSGKIHLFWGTFDRDYLNIMKDVTPVREKGVYERIVNDYSDYKHKWQDAIITFIEYLLSEDDAWCRIPDHASFARQISIRKRLERLAKNILRNI